MRILICAAAATVLAFAGAQDAFADAEPGQGYFSIMGSYIDDDTERDLEDAVNGGQMGIGYAVNDQWNLEGFISMATPDATLPGVEDEEHLGVGVDLQRVFRRSESFSPYVFLGLGYFQTTVRGVDRDGEMYSFGAGFLVDLFDTNVALRGEFRRRTETASRNNMNDSLFSLGLQIPFGAASQPMTYTEVEGDADGDGVGDNSDRCPDTPAGARVDANGCELDSDGDGVKDSKDECPGTPRGVPVDAKGCPMDSDGDGVTDDKDECPGTPAGVQVDVRGCEIKEEIRLEGVNFETNSDRLLSGAERILNEAVATLKKNPTIKFEVAGHTDSDGSAEYNEGLSARRAQTVHDYLANNGIDVNRMSVRGYGESEPIADNSTAAGKAQNRRVVLRITER
jgi:OOP family OmpA-OmpF porin